MQYIKFFQKKYKIILANLLISIFVACLIEKFFYPNISFDIKRGVFCIITTFIIDIIIYKNLPKKKQNKILKFIDKTFKNIKNIIKKIIKNKNMIKYGFSILITIYATIFYKEIYYLIFGLCEIYLIAILTNIILKKHHKTALILNGILMFAFNINMAVLIFGGSFVSLIMLTNMDSLEALSGKALIYIAGFLAVLLFSFMPIKEIKNKFKYPYIILLYEIILIVFVGLSYSVFCNYYLTIADEIHYLQVQNHIKNHPSDKKTFYHKDIKDYVQYDNSVTKKPNIIVIFTEGLSKHIITDERNIMPNVQNYMTKSINFTGYYNHTAATYRGLIGQLYSGYQLHNTDRNYLISMQSILTKNGYTTEFINTEPLNTEFTNYLKNLNFDNFVSYKYGNKKYVTDKDAYELLFEEAKKLNNESSPFFLSTYTFETHVSYDSSDQKYGDGSNRMLNKFYNVDYHFGEFIKNIEDSDLYDNTIVIFTTDHATYTDSDYAKTFDMSKRSFDFLDEIPLLIYHKNVKPQTIEVNGRNSLDLAPTILDYIDISSENYFLGQSLFAEKENKFDTIYNDVSYLATSKNKQLLSIENNEVVQYDLNNYISVAHKKSKD